MEVFYANLLQKSLHMLYRSFYLTYSTKWLTEPAFKIDVWAAINNENLIDLRHFEK